MKNFTLIVALFFSAMWSLQAQPCSTGLAQFGDAESNPFGLFSKGGLPNPVILVHLLDVDLDGRDDAFVTDIICIGPGCPNLVQSETRYFRNVGDGEPEFVLETIFTDAQAPFGWPGIPNVDIDGDCDMDIVRGWFFELEPGDSSNITHVVFYENMAADNGHPGHFDFDNSPIQVNPWGIELPVSPISGNPLGLIWPSFGDLNGDGKLDMFPGGFFMGNADEAFYYFENIGTGSSPQFAEPVINPFGLQFHCCNHYSRMVDVDCDGDLDIFTDHADGPGSLYFYENIGTSTDPDFSCDPFLWSDNLFNPVYGAFTDADGDGDLDAFTGGDDVRYYENITDLACADNSLMASFNFVGNGLDFAFTDESQGNPTEWFWNFGDGETSTEQNPTYTYEDFGNYEVCLTVSSGTGCHTYCEPFNITSLRENKSDAVVYLAPNPVQDELQLTLRSQVVLGNVGLEIFDPLGKRVFAKDLGTAGNELSETLDVSQLLPGIYLLKIGLGEKTLVRKFVRAGH